MRKITEKVILRFRDYLITEEKSVLTQQKYIRDIRAFMAWLGNRPIQKGAVVEYKQHLLHSYAPASANSILSALNTFFSFQEWDDCKVKTVPMQRQLFLTPDKELTKTEYVRLLDAASKKQNKQLFYLLQTICATGIRVSELRFITAENVKTGKAIISCKSKMRVVFLPKQLCDLLKKYMIMYRIESGPIFVTRKGNPLNRSNIWKLMKSLCACAGVAKEKVFPHNLRHLFARTFYSLKKDIVRLADLLGHSSVNTTRIYTVETGVEHRKQLQKLGLLWRSGKCKCTFPKVCSAGMKKTAF